MGCEWVGTGGGCWAIRVHAGVSDAWPARMSASGAAAVELHGPMAAPDVPALLLLLRVCLQRTRRTGGTRARRPRWRQRAARAMTTVSIVSTAAYSVLGWSSLLAALLPAMLPPVPLLIRQLLSRGPPACSCGRGDGQ